MNFIHSFQSEWLKKKRSLASWLVVAGALFVPFVIFLSRVKNHDKLGDFYRADDFWTKTWNQTWEAMAAFLLPIGIVLATGLIAQIEFKNNSWKQLHATPQRFSTIYFAKFFVIVVMLVQVFALFLAAMYLSSVIPSMLFSGTPYPTAPIPFDVFAAFTARQFVECLPVLALQYAISVHFKNFLVPVGVGFAIWFLGVGMLSWEHSYWLPYLHGTIDYLMSSGQFRNRTVPVNVTSLALIYAVIFTIAGYTVYVRKSEKG